MSNRVQPTGVLTPEQYRQQQSARAGLNQRIGEQSYRYEMGPEQGGDSKSKSASKMLINIAFIAILAAGIVGSFWAAFDMDKFVNFLEVFAYVWAPLVVAVGGGRAFKNYVQKKYHAQEGQIPLQNPSRDEGQPPQ